MAFICSISGVQPEEPCLSRTGYVFERRLIEKHLQETATCPATGEPLTVDDLIPIKCDKTVKPRPATSMSIPGILSLLQSEWDALALETYNLRTHANTVRKQLCQSLYEHDAATRVIARLIKERDRALQQVEALEKQLLEFRTNYDAGAIEVGLDDASVSRIEQLAKALMAERKKRDVTKFTPANEIAKFSQTGDYRTHSSTTPGILTVTMDQFGERYGRTACFTGGADGAVIHFDLGTGKTLTRMTNHMKAVNSVVAHQFTNIVVSGSDDKTMRVWRAPDIPETDSEFTCAHVIKSSKAGIMSLSLHASGEYFLGGAADGLWHLVELESGRVIKVCRDIPSPCANLEFHPDGLLAAGSGADGSIHIWDLRTQTLTSSLAHETPSRLASLSFSENGYHLATVSEDGQLRLWDLRKSKVFASTDCNVSPAVVKFDKSGTTLAVGSTKVELYALVDKTTVNVVGTFEGHSGYITDLEFGPNSKFLLTTCRDKSLRLFS
ncbi:Pre-mRNA-processing factor 19 [Babesia sp. Xinjiang]|uniref:Pre-mRNA-processing factor 19 n=1 Tax=Babesia sp. Xinjiang TaxID=462227 RepID=UPI000A23B756|nr:Pre-mRNA-processing factor 19 [Babesia sp. Xinjiang]ORM40270.1 Pre-mRNA-processing factor 19 [Babesia sp. Xinjiang]